MLEVGHVEVQKGVVFGKDTDTFHSHSPFFYAVHSKLLVAAKTKPVEKFEVAVEKQHTLCSHTHAHTNANAHAHTHTHAHTSGLPSHEVL